jgi:hypothetical protein
MRLTMLLAVALFLGGCGGFPFRRAKTPPPPGPTPVRIPDQVASLEPAPAPKNLPAPPAISASTANTKTASPNAVGVPATPTAGPPRPVKAKAPPVKRAAVAPPPVPPPAAVETPVPEAPAFRLGELRTADEKEKLRKQTEQMIGQCAAALTAAEGRSLTSMQTEMVSRVRTFTQQARETLDKDPGEARNFAAKGRTFAEALLAELK